ncbi:snRNA-activating protein complex subunit 1-like [Melanotaenia boesemani]|uniref:snRNA-activating protein complex subunit 1-like n=1 Tax=Melanotaenia boesemani TaxID=1250792 RepID=UPI001C042FB3|nr:snRNA-activating protein complex subunit 1-like [Melanotaenia boesemani]
MPRVPPAYSDVFYSPLTEDVEELLGRFQRTDSVRYEDFSAIWRDMRFSDVFLGMTNNGEIKRFSRVTMATAMKYFLPPYSYQIRTGGLYLMFGFYNMQLAVPPVRIRLALKDWDHVQAFLRDSVDAQHYDVVYIYQKLVAAKAFHYTAMPHFLTFQKHHNLKNDPLPAEFLGRTTAVQELMSADFLDELADIQRHYEKLKGGTMKVNTQVNMVNPELALQVKHCMSEFITWQEKTFPAQSKKHKKAGDEDDEEEEEEDDDDDVEPTEEESCSRRARLLSSIKQKSYRNYQEVSKSRRHRHVEVVDSCSSGAKQAWKAPVPQKKKRPISLRARTYKSLGVTKEDSTAQAWLLSVPEQLEGLLNVKRLDQSAPYKLSE